ncbi:MAG: lipoate--protein ligase family protein [Deltaproteobacteria bacterium]|nr:lipoate--protein ligase family protein [Deltaproteobacteria bacterium]
MRNWRLIQDAPADGAGNMASDEAILRAVEKGAVAPTLRLYEWDRPAISIGYTQDPARFIHRAQGCGVPVVRRITGGRAVMHHMEMTYSVVCVVSHPLFSAGIGGAYSILSGCILNALRDIGIEAALSPGRRRGATLRESCFHAPARHEILVNGRKLVGSAQRRFKNAFLQHGSILMDVDKGLFARVFDGAAIGEIGWVRDFSTAGKEELAAAFVRRMEEGLGVEFIEDTLSGGEVYLKGVIAERRYSRGEWNLNGDDGDMESRISAVNI